MPTATTISVAETVDLLDGPLSSFSAGLQTGLYALWLGSGISRECVVGLDGVLAKLLENLRLRITGPDCEHHRAFDKILGLGELNLERPFLQVMRNDLVRDFDKLLAVLAPWQVWFFEKRRAARLIDKIFDKEPNYGRLYEFKAQLSRQLDDKRDKVMQNFRDTYSSEASMTERHRYLAEASAEELVDCNLSYLDTVAAMDIITKNLIDRCAGSSFRIVELIFPSRRRQAALVETPWASY